MAAQKKQHYVPQFYMKSFANDKGGISILNLSDYSVRNEVPYKSQCSIDYFYGKDGEWENILSRKESEWASVLRKMNAEETITSAEMKSIREFIVYQRQRTEAEDISIPCQEK